MPQSRGRLIFRRCTTFCPAISRCHGKAMRLFSIIWITTPRKPASGRITPSISSARSKLTMGKTRQRKTISVMAFFRNSPATIPSSNISTNMLDGKMEGMFLMGQNPAVGAPNSRLQRKALSKLKWLVVREMVEIESANFWRESPEVERGELKPEEIETEIFFFPGGWSRREGRRLHEHAATFAVARKSGRASGGRAFGRMVYTSTRVASDRQSKTIRRPAR